MEIRMSRLKEEATMKRIGKKGETQIDAEETQSTEENKTRKMEDSTEKKIRRSAYKHNRTKDNGRTAKLSNNPQQHDCHDCISPTDR